MKPEPTVIFGIHVVLEKLNASPDEIAEIFVSGDAGRAVETKAQKLGIRVTRGSRELLDQLTAGERHQGAVAKMAAYSYGAISELLNAGSSSSLPQRVLFLDGIMDPRNFGALLRCADGAGVRHVVIPKDRSVKVTPTVIKSSAGAAHHVQVYRVTNLRQTMKQLKNRGFWLVGLDAGAKTSVYDGTYPARLGIVLGNEGQGMRPLVRRECDFLVSIPMCGKVASLNVAVAGAVFLFEVLRQQRNIDVGGPTRK
jgi:23S rRNA (guanosine2251-2'-O)-methyltransferase